jgi:hypothetical protein
MSIYDRNKGKTEPDAASKPEDPAKASTTTDTSTEPKVKTDEKAGPDLAALNANGPGTEKAHQDAAAKQAGTSASSDIQEGDYVVAEGRSITSQRGILGPGETVSPKDFGGQERLDELVKAGTLVRKGEQTKSEPDTK